MFWHTPLLDYTQLGPEIIVVDRKLIKVFNSSRLSKCEQSGPTAIIGH